MKKFTFVALSLLAFTSLPGFAGSKTVVEYGVVQQSQIISSQTRSHPLRTVAAGALGGVVGHQFGNGKGQTAMTAAGAVAGAGVSRHRQSQQAIQQLELTIKMQSGQLIQVVQQVDGRLTFSQGDKVRVLTSGSNTRVDKSV
ncbi:MULTISPECIES: glycine zipper 2TM domain-containing protein [unclassified Raoultella]|uniref:glycine zipper 2TM domain-containing protein n=1 Tax=unclassified Raoultella TaxID=2627600 RepID=UPI00135AB291|nr:MULTISPECIES: glycine zipper 2TM domain-containing protein [unclassified Raoultella]